MSTKHNLLKVFSVIALLAMIFSNIQPSIVQAQSGGGGERQKVDVRGGGGVNRKVNSKSGKLSFIGPEKGQVLAAAEALQTSIRPQDPALALAKRFAPEFGIQNPEQDLVATKNQRGQNGRITARYQQKYQGIPVMGGELIVNTNDNGDLYSMNGEVSPDLSLSTQPTIDAATAQETALQEVAKSYQKKSEDFIATEPQLWIYDESLLKESTRPSELVWRMDVTSKDAGMPVRELVLVSAQSGEVSLHFNQIDTAWSLPSQNSQVVALKPQVMPASAPSIVKYEDLVVDQARNRLYGADKAGNKIDVINMTDLSVISSYSVVYGAAPVSLDLSPDGNELAIAQSGIGFVKFVNLVDGTLSETPAVLTGPSTKVTDVIYGRTGLLYALTDKGLHVIDLTVTPHAEDVAQYTPPDGYSYYYDQRYGAISSDKNTLYYVNYSGTSAYDSFNQYNISAGLSKPALIKQTHLSGYSSGVRLSLIDDASILITSGSVYNTSDLTPKARNFQTQNPATALGSKNFYVTLYDNASGADTLKFFDKDSSYILSSLSTNVTGTTGAIAATADGNTLFVSSTGGMAKFTIGNTPPGTAIALPSSNHKYNDLAIDLPRSLVYGTDTSNRIDVIDLNTGNVVNSYLLPSGASPKGIDLSPDGSELAIALNGLEKILFMNPQTGATIAVVRPQMDEADIYYTNLPFDVIYGRTGRLYSDGNPSSGGFDYIHVINTSTHTWVSKSSGIYRTGGEFSIRSDKNYLYENETFSPNNIYIFDVQTDTVTQLYQGPHGPVYANKFSIIPDGSKIFTSSGQVWDSIMQSQLGTLEGAPGKLVEYVPNQNMVVLSVSAGTGNDVLKFINTTDYHLIGTYTPSPAGTINEMEVSSDGNKLVLNINNQIQILNLNPALPSGISVNSGSNQAALPLVQFSQPLKVKLQNYLAQPLAGITVTFTAPASGATGTFATGGNTATGITDINGIATSPLFTANNIRGGYVVKATAPGLASSADFMLANGNLQVIKTYTAGNTTSIPGSFLCDQNTPGCTNGINIHADKAHLYAIGTYNLYLDQYNRNGIDQNNLPIISTVHFGSWYENAFWSGSQMVYGDAYGFPLADDVVAHELTHGVTEYESNLFYYFQSGAINESLSDVFGEYYDQTNGQGNDATNVKWQMGEDVSGMGALRSMSDPTIYGDPDMMTSPNYFIGGDDNGGVHYNSGVNNKAVYLMVDGDTFNAKTITGIGWDKVGAIYYEVNANLLTSGADYSDLYYAVQQACTNLIGGSKGITAADCVQVKNALDAVEMNYRQKNVANFEDPGFEYSLFSDYYWDQYSTNFYSPLCSITYCSGMNGTAAPRTGSVWGWFGGTAANETAWLSQPVYFPRGYSSIKLNFYLWIGRADKGSDANDRFMAQVDGVTVFTANATQKSSYSSYKLVSVDVNRFAKNSLHTIKFVSVTNGQRVDFNLDDVSLTDTSSRIIRGNVGTAGAVLSYSNNGMKAVTSDANGNYTIAVPYNWSGTVTPWRACYTFTPGNLVYNKLVADRGGQNYSVVFNGPNCGVSAGIYNDTDPNWTYIGKWASYSGSGPYNSDLHYTGKPGDWAWFIFNGTQFILNYTQATNRGSFEVYVDGDKIGTVDANGTTQWQKTFTSPVYPAGMHVAQFKNIGGKGPVFDVDAIDIRNTAAPGAGMYDDGYFNWRYTGKWASYSGSGPYNNTLHYSGTTGNIAAFMFTGTQFILNYSQATNRGSFEVYVDGNKITTVNANGTTQWQKVYVSPVYSSGTHEVQLKNIGGSGSVLDVDALQIFNGAIPGIGKYDDNDVNWSYSGSWPTFSGAGPYNDTLRYTGKVGNTASFPFSGTQFTLSYTQNTNRGSFEVYVDGSKIATVNANGTLQWRKTFTSPILAAGVHVAQIKNIGGTNPVIDVDAIEVLDTPIPAAGKYDDSGNWFYTGKWVNFSGGGPFNNDTLRYTGKVGNTASFPFTGTQFTLSYTQNTNRGSFEVYVDGGKIATVNANGALQWQKTFTSPILTDSTHVVQLKNIGGTSSVTDIDAIEILDTPVPAAGKYDDINANWFYYGTWSTFSGSGPYNNSLRYTTGVGNWAWFPFDGTQFILTYTQNTNRGSFEVYVDGSRIATIVATGILQWQKTYTSPTFTAGTHVVQFKNIGGSGSMTDVDAIQVLP